MRRPRVRDVVSVRSSAWRVTVMLAVVVGLLVLSVVGWTTELVNGLAEEQLSRVELPSVADLGVDAARADLESLGFTVAVVRRPNELVPDGTAFGQEPIAGSKLAPGDRVSILVSSGPAGVPVPEVKGLNQADAVSSIAADGLVAQVESVTDEITPAGQVLSSDPQGGSSVGNGGVVKIQVSAGPAPRQVPNVVGSTLTDALVSLGREGLGVGQIVRVTRTDVPTGQVVEVDPPAGTQQARDYPVKLTVADTPTQVTVRSFVGLLQASAETVASAIGVKLDVQTRPVAAGDPTIGRVISQGVPPFSQVDSGSTVQITVAVSG